MSTPTLGSLVHSFFVDHLQVQKGLRLASIRSYRDAVRLFLDFIAREARRPITRLSPQDLTCERVQRFLQHGKGAKWLVCPRWTETARQLQDLLRQRDPPPSPEDPVFVSRPRQPLTRFGIYKIVRRHASRLATSARSSPNPSVSPHTFR